MSDKQMAETETTVHGQSLWREAWRQLRLNRIAMASLWVILVYLTLALFGEGTYWYYNVRDITPSYQQTSLGSEYLPPSIFRHPFALADGEGGQAQCSDRKSVV